MSIEELFQQRCQKPAMYPDIWEHLPKLSEYASKVSHITEFGVRQGNSTIAFWHGLVRNGGCLVSYDINKPEFNACPPPTISWVFNQMNTGEEGFEIYPTDLLFIDSCHDYAHVIKELKQERHVRKYIIMHDVSPMWIGGFGPLRAMTEFLDLNRNWRLIEFHDNCNGLAILERLT